MHQKLEENIKNPETRLKNKLNNVFIIKQLKNIVRNHSMATIFTNRPSSLSTIKSTSISIYESLWSSCKSTNNKTPGVSKLEWITHFRIKEILTSERAARAFSFNLSSQEDSGLSQMHFGLQDTFWSVYSNLLMQLCNSCANFCTHHLYYNIYTKCWSQNFDFRV